MRLGPIKPGDHNFEPSTVDELLAHWRESGRMTVPAKQGGLVGLIVDAIIKVGSENIPPMTAMVRARTTIYQPKTWFGVLVGKPPNEKYPLPLLVIEDVSGDRGRWHQVKSD